MSEIEKMYRVGDVTKLLSVSRKTLYKWINEGLIKSVKVMGQIKIPESSVRAMIKTNKKD